MQGHQRETTLVFLWANIGGIGGTERRASEFLPALKRDGIDIHAISIGGERTSFAKLLAQHGIEVALVATNKELARKLDAIDPDAVIAFGFNASLRARAVKLTSRAGYVLVDARNGLEAGRSELLWTLDRATQFLVHRYMTNSTAAAKELRERGIQNRRIAVNISALGNEWLELANVPREGATVIMVGNSRPEKGHELAVRVISKLAHPIHLKLYTNDGTRVKTEWKRHHLDERHTLTVVENHVMTPQDYAAASVMLHPSFYESLPRSVLEAKSQGTIVIATTAGSTAEALTDRDFAVPPGDESRILQALEQALQLHAGIDTSAGTPRSVDDYCRELMLIVGSPTPNLPSKGN